MFEARTAAVRPHNVVSRPADLSAPAVDVVTADQRSRGARQWAPVALVLALVGWELWSLRATTLPVAYLNDGSVHEQMTRFAAKLISAGRLPFSTWFPYIGLGSAQFLHYQSLGSVLVGAAGTVVGANEAFRWSVYLLVCCWPLAIYWSARLFGFQRSASAAAALLSPFVVSFTGVGFEHGSYLWIGGAELWTQLLGSWALPFAWALTWRAMKDARFLWPAAGLIALTVALHFMCGYLAILGVFVLGLAAEGRWRARLARTTVLFVASFAAAAWVIVPLVLLSKWSAINQPLANTVYVKGYGARQELTWLFTGQVFDAKRSLPVITIVVLIGLALAVAGWRKRPLTRGLVALFGLSLLLSFGSTTWGPLANVLPAHADLYFRRFLMGSQLAGLYLAGTGVVFTWQLLRRVVDILVVWRPARLLAIGCLAAGAIAWVSPAVAQIARYDNRDAATIQTQRTGDESQGAVIAPLIEYIKQHGGGRTYAGLSSNWGQSFTVGLVPVYKYLESEDIDQVTYLVPTLSLMLDPETNFDEDNPADYVLFGIRYILLPTGASSPVPAQIVMTRGPYSLWLIGNNGYVDPLEVTGSLSADRADVGSSSLDLLYELGPNEDWAVRWPGLPHPPAPSSPEANLERGLPPAGTVTRTVADLSDGSLSTEVTMLKRGTLLFSVSYDPGWHAWVDGRPVATEMLAPAVIGVQLTAGAHHVVFRYIGFRWYPELWALGVLGLAGAFWAGRRWRSVSPDDTSSTRTPDRPPALIDQQH
jgi:Bacterial membrane protein YfhO